MVDRFCSSNNIQDELRLIFRLCGTPNENEWPGVRRLPDYRLFPRHPPQLDWSQEVPHMSDVGVDLLKKLLVPNPKGRLSAEEALMHPYFSLLNNRAK